VARGFTHNERFVVTLCDGRSVFAKRAVDNVTADWLRREHRMYESLAGRHFVPELVGWVDVDLPILILEDLSREVWPPPWDRSQINSVLSALAEVAQSRYPDDLPKLIDREQSDEGWNQVLLDPTAFLSLGLCHADWLEREGPELQRASSAAPLAGNSLVHCDVRSDNLCLRDGAAVLFDWNLASIGNPQFDIAFWLPSLASEGSSLPEEVMPDCPPELAAYVAGFFASRAGLPIVPHAPLVRSVQLRQLKTALPWATRVLELHQPD
jgi:hypothetical protein